MVSNATVTLGSKTTYIFALPHEQNYVSSRSCFRQIDSGVSRRTNYVYVTPNNAIEIGEYCERR